MLAALTLDATGVRVGELEAARVVAGGDSLE
jgi:hypothetical protein